MIPKGVKNLEGKRFGRLAVISYCGIKNKSSLWNVRCDCGVEKVVHSRDLTRKKGFIRSCGCLVKEKHFNKGLGVSAKHDVYCFYRSHAKASKKNLSFALTEKEFLEEAVKPCYYCGTIFGNERKGRCGSFIYTGIDRIDSSKGYTKDNVVPCCSMCNYMKRHHSVENFMNHIRKIYEYSGNKNFLITDKWDARFLNLAKYISQWSKDPSTKTGAVIVDKDRRIVSVGYNGFAKGVSDLSERLEDRNIKYKMIVHCERNAILFAKGSLEGCTLYTWPFMSCSPCAAMVIQAGIKKCVAPKSDNARWADDFKLSKKMFEESGVELILW